MVIGQTKQFFIGYQFTMQVDVPTIYVSRQEGESYRADSRANTIIHRVKLAFGPIGLYKTILNRTGRNNFEQEFEVTNANTYLANSAAIRNDNKLYSVPVYDRNTNVTLTIKSEHPAPANVLYLTWEGAYNTIFILVFNITLTEQEVRIYIQWLKKNKMYKGMNLPLGNPWESWMQETIEKLQTALNE